MRSRGFTVIEVMMALGLLGVIIALVLPAVTDRVTARDLDRVAQSVADAVALARSNAQELGVPVAVRARRNGDSWLIEQRAVESESLASLFEDERDAPTRADAIAWDVLVELPGEILVSRAAPVPDERAPTLPIEDLAPAPEPAETDEASEIALGVFLPGGRCAGAGDVYVFVRPEDPTRSAPARKLTLSPWTSAAIIERVAASTDADVLTDEPAPPPMFEALPEDPGP